MTNATIASTIDARCVRWVDIPNRRREDMKWLHDWFDFTPGFKIVMIFLAIGTAALVMVLA